MKKILGFIGIVLIVILLAYKLGLVSLLTDVQQLRTTLNSIGWWGYLVFILLSILVSVFLLPGQFLAIVGGLCYGGLLGGALTVIGASIGASIAFVIGKYVARAYVLKKLGNNDIFKQVEKGVRENGISFLIFTRLVPVFPYAIQSYAYALTPMTLKNFSVISFLTMIPASFIYSIMASEIVVHGISAKILIELTIAGILLALLAILPKKISPKIRRLSSDYQKEEASPKDTSTKES